MTRYMFKRILLKHLIENSDDVRLKTLVCALL
jgi:hypothetical protein